MRHVESATTALEPIMYLRRRKGDIDESEREPSTGCIMSPLSGPAIHTYPVADLDRPSERRYGVPYASSRLHTTCEPSRLSESVVK